MRNTNNIFIYLSGLLAILGIFGPVAYNVMHPELTEMQLIIQFWWSYLIGIVFAGVSLSLLNKK